MASRSAASIHKGQSAELDRILASWENQYERRLLSKTLPRAMIAALFISLMAGIIAYTQFRWLAKDFALMALVICGVSVLVNLLYTLLFPRPRHIRARYFDIEFGLKERVSTALELLEGRIQTGAEIESAQIADALAQARQIDARDSITLDFRRGEWLTLLVLLVVVLLMILVPLLVGQDLTAAGPSPAVQAAQDDVREMIETIATDTELEDVDREALLNALEIALERLQEEDISDEEAFAAMSQLESQIEDVQNALQELIDLDQSSLEGAADALADFMPLADRGESDNAQEQAPPNWDELSQALAELAQETQSMTPEEAQAAAEALQQAAQELAQSNPELSEQLQDMAAALQSDDSQSLQEQLQQAQEQLQQNQQAQQASENTQQMLQDQAEQAEQAANEIARQQQANAPQEGEPETSTSGQQQGEQPGGEQASAARPGDNQGNQPAARNMPGVGESIPSERDSNTVGQGAGEGQASNTSLPGGGGEDEGARTDNRTTGAGEIRYEAIYNPTGIEGGGASEIQLETDASDQTLAEGNFDDNPLGESRVSYDTVFSDYENAAHRALESDYVPLGLRDVVRDYFTSLEP